MAISDKYIEVIVRQMLRRVRIDEGGDTNFLLEQQVDRFRFSEENEKVLQNGGRPAIWRPLLLGIGQGVALDRQFCFRGQLPGHDPRTQ